MSPRSERIEKLKQISRERVLILDGSWGVMFQKRKLGQVQRRTSRLFANTLGSGVMFNAPDGTPRTLAANLFLVDLHGISCCSLGWNYRLPAGEACSAPPFFMLFMAVFRSS